MSFRLLGKILFHKIKKNVTTGHATLNVSYDVILKIMQSAHLNPGEVSPEFSWHCLQSLFPGKVAQTFRLKDNSSPYYRNLMLVLFRVFEVNIP